MSYVLYQLISKPADQKHVTKVPDVNNHCLTDIGIISPILQKFVSLSQTWKNRSFRITNFWKISKLGIMPLCRCIWFWIDFKSLRQFKKNDYLFRPVVCPSVLSSAWNNTIPTGQVFWKLIFGYFLKICWEYQILMKMLR